MVTTTTTKSWSPMWNSLDRSCILCAVCKSVFTVAEIYQHSVRPVTSTTLTWLRPPRPSHGLWCEIVWIYLVFCVLYVNQSSLIARYINTLIQCPLSNSPQCFAIPKWRRFFREAPFMLKEIYWENFQVELCIAYVEARPSVQHIRSAVEIVPKYWQFLLGFLHKYVQNFYNSCWRVSRFTCKFEWKASEYDRGDFWVFRLRPSARILDDSGGMVGRPWSCLRTFYRREMGEARRKKGLRNQESRHR